MESILIIDDDVSLCTMLKEYLALHQMQLSMSHHGFIGLEQASSGGFDLVLLDIMLPGIDGLNVLRRLRPVSAVNVLLLTARSDVGDRIAGLDIGADDYLPKPFNPRELVARIKAILRRRPFPHVEAPPNPPSARLCVHGFELNRSTRAVRYHGHRLALTDGEFALLEALLESPGVVLDREYLFGRISQRPFHPLDRSLDMLVSRLRRKLGVSDNPGQAIRTIRSTGYVFATPGSSALHSQLEVAGEIESKFS